MSIITTDSIAQDKRKIIQLSGVVFGEDSVSRVSGVHIYVPKSGRGTISNNAGYFSFPTLEGDSIVISSIGYVRKYYIVPTKIATQFLTITIKMKLSTTNLEGIYVMPFPTEEAFKGAMLALNIPTDRGVVLDLLSNEKFMLMMNNAPMSGYANYRYYIDQYSGSIDYSFQVRANPLLDPFAWYRFFRDLKKKK